MFDLTTFGNDLTINSLEIHTNETTDTSVSVYTKSGTYVGSETNSALWTLRDTVSVTGQGLNNPTFVDIADFSLSASSVTGIYITLGVGESIQYTNGNGSNQSFSNGDLQLDLGIGTAGLFGDVSTFSPRVWNGTINYTVDSASVPFEFSPTLGLLLVAGLLGSNHFYRQHEAKKVVLDSEV